MTTAARGDRASRLNFLSATVCVDLARQMLRADRPPFEPGQSRRVLIVCPYRPHAQLLNLLLHEQELTGEVQAGTAHTFQGSEAEVVILDLVNDDPHWRVGLFMPAQDDDARRLFNVAMTRTQRRLLIVGDLDYNTKQAKNAFLGRDLLPLLTDSYPRVNALDVVPTSLAARTAASQLSMLGGEVEPDENRIVVNQHDFFPLFLGDLKRATRRAVVFSPFITANRMAKLEPALRALVERDVALYVVTRTLDDRGKRELSEYRRLEQQLTDWGAVVIHKRHMHEKLVFIDDTIVWCGSLNPLSFADTQEVMERRRSTKVFDDFARTMRLADLVGGFAQGTPICPICGRDMEVAEGNSDVFYWTCPTKHCFTRKIEAPELVSGRLVCSNCAADVRYGEWGAEPHWRCNLNNKHRQRVAPSHLRLPKMRELVPKAELGKLDKRLGAWASGRPSSATDAEEVLSS